MVSHLQDKEYKNISAIVLSGGRSSRMGTDKCELEYEGQSLINHQIGKMKKIGIEDIVASGYRGKMCDAKIVADDIMKGPLSGLLKGLMAIKNDRAFVISVDVPLVRLESIKRIIDYSFEKDFDITMLRHRDRREPLIAVYKKNLIDIIRVLLNGDNYSMMKLADMVSYGFVDLDDEDSFYLNVNNKDDYNKLLKINI